MIKGNITIVGDGNLPPNDDKYILAEELGKALIDNDYRIITGGLGGIMEAVSKGAHSSKKYNDGKIIGILPGFDPQDANEYVDIVIPTGMDVVRNIIISNSDAIVAIGGGAGTLIEISTAWALKRLVIAYKVEGWSGKLANTKLDKRIRYENVENDQIYGVNSEKEVINILDELLPKYNKRHHGVKDRRKK